MKAEQELDSMILADEEQESKIKQANIFQLGIFMIFLIKLWV
jgi:hypothetical protein